MARLEILAWKSWRILMIVIGAPCICDIHVGRAYQTMDIMRHQWTILILGHQYSWYILFPFQPKDKNHFSMWPTQFNFGSKGRFWKTTFMLIWYCSTPMSCKIECGLHWHRRLNGHTRGWHVRPHMHIGKHMLCHVSTSYHINNMKRNKK